VNQPTILFMNTPVTNQLQFQWADDDGNEATSTLLLSPGSDITVDLDSGDVTKQLRFVVEETAGFADSNYTDIYQSDLNASGSWESVTTTENGDGVLVDTTNLTDRAPSTQRVGSGTFITTNDGQTTDGTPGGPDHASMQSPSLPQHARDDLYPFPIFAIFPSLYHEIVDVD